MVAEGLRRKPLDVNAVALSPEGEAAVAAGLLNRAQAVAAYAPPVPRLVLGPPGSGKTKTLVERMGVLFDQGVKPLEIFCSSFTGAASAEIVERINARHGGRLVAPEGKQLMFGTLNSLGNLMLRKALAPRAGIQIKGRSLSGYPQTEFVRNLGIELRPKGAGARTSKKRDSGSAASGSSVELSAAAKAGWYGAGFGGDELLDLGAVGAGNVLTELVAGKVPAAVLLGQVHDLPFLDLVSRWQGQLIFPEDAIRIAEGDGGKTLPDERLAQRARDYARYKEALRNAGLIDLADQIALTVKILRERPDDLAFFQEKWKAFVVDEYQDVNAASGTFVDLLAGKHHHLWCVGDPDQTLYSFNGSDPDYILNFIERWPDGEVIALEQNYRSRPVIVASANRLIRNNKDRYETAMVATKAAQSLSNDVGRALFTPAPNRSDIDACRPENVEVVTYPDDITEAEDIARKIRGLMDLGVAPGEIAILCRSAFRSFQIVQALRGAGVRIRVLRGADKGEPDESRLVEGLVRAVYYPVHSGPGQTDLEIIRQLIGGDPRGQKLLAEASRLKNEGYAAPERWPALLAAVADAVTAEGPKDKAPPQDEFDLGPPPPSRWEIRVRATAQAAARAGSYDAWCAAAAIVGKTDAPDGNGDGVICTTLGTIHGVKGLEYDYVFIVGVENDVCPDNGAVANEEERRLFYVALTRAREALTVSWAAKRAGDRFKSKRSVYLEEAFHGTPGVAWSDYGVDSTAGGTGTGLNIEALETASTWSARRQETGNQTPGGQGGTSPTERTAVGGLGSWAAGEAKKAGARSGSKPAAEPTITPAVSVTVPAQAATVVADKGWGYRITICGGTEEMSVWHVRIETAEGRIPLDTYVNPAGDYSAYVAAVQTGVSANVLADAPDVQIVVATIRQLVKQAIDQGKDARIVTTAEAARALGIDRWRGVILEN